MILPRVQDRASIASRPGSAAECEVNKEEIVRVLVRAAEDDRFIARMAGGGEDALRGYNLTWRERAALLSGDLRWVEAHLGKLNLRLRTWFDCRLQQEIW